MPSASGVYSLPPGYLAVTGEPILASQHNPPLEDIAAGLTARLSRDGSAPMTGALKAVSGTATAPGYVFSVDASTGFSKTTNGIGISVGGAQVAEITAAGFASGVRFIGELIPYSGGTPPALTVVPSGQTLSRTTYAALWAFAQTEIASGNAFYNNGNGSTTFGIRDCRGRTIAAVDGSGTILSGATIGALLGTDTHTLTAAQIPTITSTNPSQNITVTSGNKLLYSPSGGTFDFNPTGAPGYRTALNDANFALATSTGANSISVVTSGTSGASHPNTQPTVVCNHLLFAGA